MSVSDIVCPLCEKIMVTSVKYPTRQQKKQKLERNKCIGILGGGHLLPKGTLGEEDVITITRCINCFLETIRLRNAHGVNHFRYFNTFKEICANKINIDVYKNALEEIINERKTFDDFEDDFVLEQDKLQSAVLDYLMKQKLNDLSIIETFENLDFNSLQDVRELKEESFDYICFDWSTAEFCNWDDNPEILLHFLNTLKIEGIFLLDCHAGSRIKRFDFWYDAFPKYGVVKKDNIFYRKEQKNKYLQEIVSTLKQKISEQSKILEGKEFTVKLKNSKRIFNYRQLREETFIVIKRSS